MRFCRRLAAAALLTVLLAVSVAAAVARQHVSARPTFTRDVAPILYRNCANCHRPGEIAPMSLLTFEDARAYLREIGDEVSTGHMPPWHADAPAGTFENERRLTDQDRQAILDWIQQGAPRGDPKDQPPHPAYVEGWSIGRPDVVFQMPEEFSVPAEGKVDYAYASIPTGFTETRYVQAIEVRPGNRAVVHHVLVSYNAPGGSPQGPVLNVNHDWQMLPKPEMDDLRPQKHTMTRSRLIATYAPGTSAQTFRPGTALRLEAGGMLELQLHYTATGRATSDRTRVGLIFSRDPSPREVRAGSFFNSTFVLPAGASDIAVPADVEFAQDATVWGLLPHTHLRGKRWEYRLQLPDGTSTVILSVPRYDFHWQTYYMFNAPLQVPRGATIHSTAWYDNSAANRSNPDPRADVTWGDQTWDEMQYTGILYSAGFTPGYLPPHK
jgi:mono/diheme cytochrome c family protein